MRQMRVTYMQAMNYQLMATRQTIGPGAADSRLDTSSLAAVYPALHDPQQYRKAADSTSWTIATTNT
jgi:hypothetical protein